MLLSDKEKLLLIKEALELKWGEFGSSDAVVDRIEEILNNNKDE